MSFITIFVFFSPFTPSLLTPLIVLNRVVTLLETYQ